MRSFYLSISPIEINILKTRLVLYQENRMKKYSLIIRYFLPASSRSRKNLFDPRCFGGVLYKID